MICMGKLTNIHIHLINVHVKSVYSGAFLSYPAELRYPMPPENVKGTKRNAKGMCLYQRYS